MNNPRQIISFFTLLLIALQSTSATSTVQDTCRPDFSDIYDFEIGDIFQYRQTYSSSAGGDNPTKEIVTQYTITGKYNFNNTYEYSISGWRQSYQYSNESDDGESEEDTSSIELFDTLISYTDSTNHILNVCPNTITPLYASGISELGYGTIYTTVLLDKSDSLFSKTVGGKDNIFNYSADTLNTVSTISYKAVYQQSMGLISMKLSFFENTESNILEGFLRGADTTGSVDATRNPNQEEVDETTTSLKGKTANNTLFIYPNPTDNYLKIISDKSITSVSLYTLNGQKVFTIEKPDQTIDISAVQPGIYLLKAYTVSDPEIFIERILIY